MGGCRRVRERGREGRHPRRKTRQQTLSRQGVGVGSGDHRDIKTAPQRSQNQNLKQSRDLRRRMTAKVPLLKQRQTVGQRQTDVLKQQIWKEKEQKENKNEVPIGS